MKLAVLNITSGGLSGGYRNYLKNILPRMAAHSQISDLLVGIPEKAKFSNPEKDLLELILIPLKTSFLSKSVIRDNMENIRKFNPDVVFVPTARQFKLNGIPTVNMIRNMEPLVYANKENPLPEKIINWLRGREAKEVIHKADRIVAVSKFVCDFLIEKCCVSGHRIGVVYHGVNEFNKINFKKPERVSDKWAGRFLFTAGSIRPARGLEDLISAFNKINGLSKISGIVIAGNVAPKMDSYLKRLKSLVQQHGLSIKICWAGSMNNEEMSWCYQNCYAFIMTSRVEACPNIALEALSHGCISISDDSPPMPEIFGDSAIYYVTGNSDSLARSIDSLLSKGMSKRTKMAEKAMIRASGFSWDVCVDKTISELNRAIEDFNNNS